MFKKLAFIFFIVIVIVSSILYHLFFSMHSLPEGEMIAEVESPNKEYSIRAYLVNVHTTVAFCIRGELIYNNESDRVKNIYWGYREDTVEIEWINDSSVRINGRTIAIPNGKYDWRREN